MSQVSLVIPHFNEQDNVDKNLSGIIKEFRKKKISLELIAVENGSADNTLQKLNALKKKFKELKVVVLKKNQGYGGGILFGLKHATSPVLGFTNADTQIAPKDIPRLYEFMQARNVKCVKTRRAVRHDGTYRFILTKVFNGICRLLFGVRTRDINGYPVFFTKQLYEKMRLRKRNWMINLEIQVKSEILKRPCEELKIIFYKRTAGKSIVKVATVLDFIKQISLFALEVWFSPRYWKLRS